MIGVLALIGAGALTAGLVLAAGEASDPARVAGAVELATFTSCDELVAWGDEASGGGGDDATSSFDMAGEAVTESAGRPDVMAADGGSASAGSQGSGAPEPAPQASMTTMAPPTTMAPSTTVAPPPEADEPEADEPVADEPEATEPAEEEADEPADDETNVAVEGVDEIDLVDRLTEDVVLVASATRLAVVDLAAAEVVEATNVPWDAQVTYDAEAGIAWVVGHPDAGGVAVERYAVDTEGLEVEGRWSTTGSLVSARRVGDELHLVATDGFSAMPAMVEPAFAGEREAMTDDVVVDDGASTSSTAAIPFSGGPVPCDEVLHPIGPSEPTATLLVTLPATGAVEPVRATEVVGSGSLVHVTTGAIYLATPQWGEEGTTTGIHRFDLETLEPTGSGAVEGSLLDDFSMSEHEGVLRVATTRDGGGFGPAVDVPMAEPGVAADDVVMTTMAPTTFPVEGEALNEIVVLDTEGTLDEVGRTERFGKPGETLHGIRFAGTTAYAVTFLQTDPFYVVDLADPASPQVVGEVELPGFSSYLHPLGDGLVVGFGPGEDGRTAAKLFDVSDPTSPTVVGDLTLGDESAVAYDHHAYLDLGDGRFAVPATTYAETMESAVVVVDTTGGRLVEVARHVVATTDVATRVLTVDDGWAILAGTQIVVLDGEGATTATIEL
ncbi:MAG TPA: beta-propeller domain-containing protein [Iamia sp.]|nr:beta-propeller domain-containing protein [Iamia sp.]